LLFAGAFTLYVIGGTAAHNEEAMEHGERVFRRSAAPADRVILDAETSVRDGIANGIG
jgi:hypothetical protein